MLQSTERFAVAVGLGIAKIRGVGGLYGLRVLGLDGGGLDGEEGAGRRGSGKAEGWKAMRWHRSELNRQ